MTQSVPASRRRVGKASWSAVSRSRRRVLGAGTVLAPGFGTGTDQTSLRRTGRRPSVTAYRSPGADGEIERAVADRDLLFDPEVSATTPTVVTASFELPLAVSGRLIKGASCCLPVVVVAPGVDVADVHLRFADHRLPRVAGVLCQPELRAGFGVEGRQCHAGVGDVQPLGVGGLLSAPAPPPYMTPEEVEARIEAELPDCEATVEPARGAHEDDHLEATVVSPAFEGESLVDQHEMVYDALGEAMTTDIHALELTTRTPSGRSA